MASPIAGSSAAAFSSAILQPFDVIRTKQQLSHHGQPIYGGFLSTIKKITLEEGWRGFFRGVGPTLWRVVPGSSVYFFLLDMISTAIRETLGDETKADLPVYWNLLTAAIARGTASIVFMPITVVKTRFEALGATRPYRSTLHALHRISVEEGVRALWSGLLPTILRDVPHSALYYAMYNKTKSLLLPVKQKVDPNLPAAFVNFTAGIISGLSATIISHPFDVVRTRLQLQNANNVDPQSRRMIPTIARLLKEEGWRTFTRGFAPRLIRRSLTPAFTWVFYEELVSIFKR